MVDPRPGDGDLRRELARVLAVAAVVAAVVLAVVFLTSDVSRDLRTPVTIAVLIGGTAFVLWRITRSPQPR